MRGAAGQRPEECAEHVSGTQAGFIGGLSGPGRSGASLRRDPGGAFVLGELCVRKRPQDACRRRREQGSPLTFRSPGRECPRAAGRKSWPCQYACGNGSFHLTIISAGAAGEFREEPLQSTAFPGSCALLPGEPVGIPEGGPVRSGAAPGGELRLSHLRNWLRAERGRALCGLRAAGGIFASGETHMRTGREVIRRNGAGRSGSGADGLSRKMAGMSADNGLTGGAGEHGGI